MTSLDLYLHPQESRRQRLSQRIAPQRSRGPTIERAMQHKIKSEHIWDLVTLNLAFNNAFEMRAHSLSRHLPYEEVIYSKVWRKESDIGYIAFVS